MIVEEVLRTSTAVSKNAIHNTPPAEAPMIGDDHDPDKDPIIKQIVESVEADLRRDDDEVERIERQAQDAKKKLEDGNKWPDQ